MATHQAPSQNCDHLTSYSFIPSPQHLPAIGSISYYNLGLFFLLPRKINYLHKLNKQLDLQIIKLPSPAIQEAVIHNMLLLDKLIKKYR